MGKSKRAPALFEVIRPRQLQESTSRFPLPKWWRTNKSDSPNYPPVSPDEPKSGDRSKIIKLVPQLDKPVAQQSLPVSSPPKTDQAPPEPPPRVDRPASNAGGVAGGDAAIGSAQGPPIVRLGGGKVQFSLNPVSLAIIFGVVVMFAFGAYQIGKGFGNLGPATDDLARADGQNDGIETAKAGKADPTVTDVPRSDRPEVRRSEAASGVTRPNTTKDDNASRSKTSVAANPPAPKTVAGKPQNDPRLEAETTGSASARRAGLNYVWIARFKPDNRDDALHARKWLSDKGIEASIDEGSSSLSLVSTTGFDYGNHDDKAKCQALLAKLKQLSPSYMQQCRAEQRDRLYTLDKPEVRKEKE